MNQWQFEIMAQKVSIRCLKLRRNEANSNCKDIFVKCGVPKEEQQQRHSGYHFRLCFCECHNLFADRLFDY
jgi:hypothetical protein